MASLQNQLFVQSEYEPPAWLSPAVSAAALPATKVELGRFPTPYHRWRVSEEDSQGLEMWIKRDDLSSFDCGGNKVRKLQFLLAKALRSGADTVVTIGGTQSNHCRATAVATRQLGLQPHLILRTRGDVIDPPSVFNKSLVGNLLFDKLVGSKISTVTQDEYNEVGSDELVRRQVNQLNAAGKKAFGIPVGGSNEVGVFGYIDCVFEIQQQGIEFDHLVFSCGSGGTAAGLSIGAKLAGFPSVHGVGVCDSPDEFYDHITSVAAALGIDQEEYGTPRDWLQLYDGQGDGYALSKPEELGFIHRVSTTTGVLLDPVYSGKGLYYFLHDIVKRHPQTFKPGQKVLFIHTGGALGLYDKSVEMAEILSKSTPDQISAMKIDEGL
jgi:D-cysteine desulfhydrase family pyridoxal phosphate-dependent enzyme